ncbi:MAG: nucleoside deaminase [Pseudomonadota bacterium]
MTTIPEPQLIDRLLSVMENDIVPLTREGVRKGNKVFGAAILRKSDLSLVIAGTNNEVENPLWHGEVHTMKQLYEMPAATRPAPGECVFFATHEPCSLCLSAITWGGYNNFYFLFSHEDSRDSFNIPHDLKILKEVFTLEPGGYNRDNGYWNSAGLMTGIDAAPEAERAGFYARVEALKEAYAEMSETYQAHKTDTEIPLN